MLVAPPQKARGGGRHPIALWGEGAVGPCICSRRPAVQGRRDRRGDAGDCRGRTASDAAPSAKLCGHRRLVGALTDDELAVWSLERLGFRRIVAHDIGTAVQSGRRSALTLE